MATDLGELIYTLRLDDQQFTGGLNSAKEKVNQSSSSMSGSMKETEEATGKLGGAFSSMAGQFVVGQAVFTAGQKVLDGLTGIIKDGIQSAKDWQNAQAQMQAGLKSTGDVSGMTAQALMGYAQAREDTTGIDKAATLQGENMLLTFTGIGKNVFPAAATAVEDMAAKMSGAIPTGEQLSNTAIQIGKALNDPTMGYTKLQKVGVTFTEQQVEQIKTMQASGNLMGAQQVILNELSREFGGSATANAQTFTGQMAILKNRLGDLIGDNIPKLLNALKEVGDWIVEHKPVFAALIGVVGGLAIAIGVALVTALWAIVAPALAAVAALWPIVAAGAAIGLVAFEIYQHWQQINKALQPVYEFFDKNIKPVLVEVGRIVKEQLIKAWDDLKKAFEQVLQTLKPYEPELKKIAIVIGIALIAPIVLAIATLAALVAAIVAVGVFLARLIGWIAEAIAWFINFEVSIAKAIVGAVEAVVSIGAKIVEWFIALPGHILGVLAGAGSWLVNIGINIVQGLINGIVSIASGVWNAIKSVADQIGHFFAGAGSWLWDTGKAIIQGLINGIENMAGAVYDKIKSVGKGIEDTAKKILKIFSPSQVFAEIGGNVSLGMAQGIDNTGVKAIDSTTNLANKVVDAGNAALGGVQNSMTNILTNNNQNQGVTYQFGPGSVNLSTADAVGAFFSIGNRNTQLELLGGSPLAGTTGV